MNRAEKYVYKVYQTKSFSAAAKELYVAQPALSTTIKKLEAELGYEIFNRKKSPITLTREGELYVEYLEKTIENEYQLKERIALLNRSKSGILTIGGSNSAAYYYLPKICGEFYRRHPDVKIVIDVGEARGIYDKLNKGTLDLVLGTRCDTSIFDAVTLCTEKYVIIVRKDYPGAEKLAEYSLTRDEVLSGDYSPEREVTDITIFRDINFFKPGANSGAWTKFPEFWNQCTNAPVRVTNFRRMDFQYSLMLAGVGAIITPPVKLIEDKRESDNLYYFVIGTPKNERRTMLIYKKNIPLSKNAAEFISIAREICKKS